MILPRLKSVFQMNFSREGLCLVFLRSLFLPVSVAICSNLAISEPPKAYDRQFWHGTFNQTSPLAWSGPIELFLRFDSDSTSPQELDGIITWTTLGEARVRILGTRTTDGSIEFRETECLDGDCSQIVLGGSHRLQSKEGGNELEGKAEGAFGLKANYVLTRIRESQ